MPLTRRIYELDGLRFIAALMVVFFHYGFRGWITGDKMDISFPELLPFCQYGYLGVDLFFMISGFVIMMTADGATARYFAAARAARLYPALWIGCTLTFLFTIFVNDPRYHVDFTDYLLNLTLLSGFLNIPSVDGVYWSLFVEIRFYAYIFILLLLGLHRYIRLFFVLWLGLSALNLFFLFPFKSLFLYGYAPYFAAGYAAYQIYKGEKRLIPYIIMGISFLLICSYAVQFGHLSGQKYHRDFSDLTIIFIEGGFCFFLLLIAHRSVPILDRPWLGILGGITYPLYLVHQNIGFMIMNSGAGLADRWALLGGTSLLVFILSYLIHKWPEAFLTPYVKKVGLILLFRLDSLQTSQRRVSNGT